MGTLYKRHERGGKTGNWYAEYTDHNGTRVKKCTKTKDRRTAQQILNHWENEAAKRSTGFINPDIERVIEQRARPINEHASEFIASLKSAGRSSIHVGRTERRLEVVIANAQWVLISDITSESVERFAAELQSLDRSNRTIAHYLQTAKQFSRWLARTKRLPSNPLDPVVKPDPKADRRRRRRMLLPTEWPYLAQAATKDRRVLYAMAIETGLRAGEIRELRGAHLIVYNKPPRVMVPSDDTKDHQDAHQFITPELASDLKPFAKRGSKLAFDLPSEHGMADMIRADLAAARKAWELDRPDEDVSENDFLRPINNRGERFDFHSLRHTCGAWLALKDVHPKKIQAVMRHKTITLTMDTYGHLFPDDTIIAINQLAPLLYGV